MDSQTYLFQALDRYCKKIGYYAFREWMNQHPEVVMQVCGVTPKF